MDLLVHNENLAIVGLEVRGFGLGGQSRIRAPEREATQTKIATDRWSTVSVVPSERKFLSLSFSQGPNGPSGQRAVAKAGPSAKKVGETKMEMAMVGV